jgi:hypothetical protein
MEHVSTRRAIILSRFAWQLKHGCLKPMCFNDHCFKCVQRQFKSDAHILRHAAQLISRTRDPSALLCTDPEYIKSERVPYQMSLYLNQVSPSFVMSSVEWFCCSFVSEDGMIDVKQL